MLSGGKKLLKPQRTKPRRFDEDEGQLKLTKKKKHHDKTFYRLMKEEEKQYTL